MERMKRMLVLVVVLLTGLYLIAEVNITHAYLVKSIENDVVNQFVVFSIEDAVTGGYVDIDESYININNGLMTIANPGLPNTPGIAYQEVSGGIYIINAGTDEEIERLMIGETLENNNFAYLWELENPQNKQLSGITTIRSNYLHTGTIFFEIGLDGYLESSNELSIEEINDPNLIIEGMPQDFEVYNYFQCFQVDFIDDPYWQNRDVCITFIYNEQYFSLWATLAGNFIELNSFQETIVTENGWQRNYQHYIIKNETENNIELSSLTFYLGYQDDEEWRTLYPESLCLAINNEWYEFILPEEQGYFTAEIDLNLLPNSESYLNCMMSVTGYGGIDMGISNVLINQNETIYTNIEVHHQIVNTSENMHDLYSPALHLQEEYQGGYGNGYGNGIEINMYPDQRWFFYNNLGPVNDNYVENSVVYFIFEMTFYDGIENYHYLPNWSVEELEEVGKIDTLINTQEEFGIYWRANSTSDGINRASMCNAYITNNIPVNETAHLQNYLQTGTYLDGYGPEIDYTGYEVTINSNSGIIGDADGDGDHDSDDTSLSIENAVNHTYENTVFGSTNSLNISRETFMFDWHTGFDPFLDNVYDNNPTDPMVVNIGYGLNYEYNSGYGRVGTNVEHTTSTSGDLLTISTPGNGASVKYYSNGEWITDSILLTDREVLRFDSRTITTAIEPMRYEISSREDEFVFVMPEEYEQLKISTISTPEITTFTEPENIPELNTQLLGNYPNPFNPETTIPFSLSEEGMVEISIYNVKGQLVKTLTNDTYSSGEHNVIWNAENVPSGVYFCRMISKEGVLTNKMILMK